MLESVRALSEASHGGLGSVSGLLKSTSSLESTSKDMRAPARRLRNALTAMLQARDITDGWLALVEASGIDCTGASGGSDAPDPT